MKATFTISLFIIWGCFAFSPAYPQSFNTFSTDSALLEKVKKSVDESKDLSNDSIKNLIDQYSISSDTIRLVFFQFDYAKRLFKEGQLEESDLLLDACIETFTLLNQTNEIGSSFFYKGLIAIRNLQSDNVLLNFQKAIQYYSDDKYWKGVVYAEIQIANYFSKQNNFAIAEQHYISALKGAEEGSDTALINLCNLNYGHCLLEQNKLEGALERYHLVDTLKLPLRNKSVLFNNLAVIYKQKEDFHNAEFYYLKSITHKTKLNDLKGIETSRINLAYIYIKTKNLTKAEQALNQAKNNISIIDNNTLLNYYHNWMYLNFELKNTAQGIDYLNKYIHLKDSISNSAFSDELLEIQKSFEIQERDKNIALLQKEDELNEVLLNFQQLVIISIAGVLIIVLALGYFINRQRIRLKKSEHNLQVQQKEIEEINAQLKLSNHAKDRILSIIGHDLRGPIGGLKELIELYMEMPEYDETDFKNLLKAAHEATTGSYHLLENLLTWANSQRGQIDFNPVTAPLRPLIKHSIGLLDSAINTRNVRFKYEVAANLKITADLNMLRTIIRNLVSNSVKYSPPDSRITISVEQNEHETTICIADDGYGMSAEQSAVLFEKKETYFIESGYNAKGTGLGLILCKEFVEQHKGHIWAESENNVGTKVCFTIPHETPRKDAIPQLSDKIQAESL